MERDISSTLKELIKLIEPIFPDNSIGDSHRSGGNSTIIIGWKLENDPKRPNKPSRRIEIIIEDAELDDYVEKNPAKQAMDREKFKKYIEQKYKQFNQEPETLRYIHPLVEQWIIPQGVFDS